MDYVADSLLAQGAGKQWSTSRTPLLARGVGGSVVFPNAISNAGGVVHARTHGPELLAGRGDCMHSHTLDVFRLVAVGGSQPYRWASTGLPVETLARAGNCASTMGTVTNALCSSWGAAIRHTCVAALQEVLDSIRTNSMMPCLT